MTSVRPLKALDPLVWATRAIWLATGVSVLCGAVLTIYWKVEGAMTESKPLQLPPRGKGALPAGPEKARANVAERNPFDPAGVAWRSPAAAREQVARLEDVRGVLTSPTLSGVFTPAGLVKPGEAFAGGTLESVNAQSLVVRMPDGNTKLLQPARQDDKVREMLLERWAATKAR